MESSVEHLRSTVVGTVLRPGDDGYDTRRRVWNGMIDRRPAVIVQCASVGDVQAALAFARAEGVPVAVRGGGHSAAGHGTCDGGVVVDLGGMTTIEVDPAARTARADGGVTWGEFDAATQAHGLAVTGGAISTTGIAGLTLGGGLGWLMRRQGLSSDNVIAFDIVTAAGELLTVDAGSHPELFWALRGGGGNFGVVTSFTYRLHPVGEVLGGMLLHPADRAGDLLRFYRGATERASDDLTLFAGLLSSPEGEPVSGIVMCHTGDPDAADAETREIRAFGPPLVDEVARKPYVAQQAMLDEGFPEGLQVYWKAHFLTGLEDAAIDTLTDHFGRVTSPLSAIIVEHLGGEVARMDHDATAFAYRDAPYNLAIIARWIDPAEADRHVGWARGLFDAMTPFSRGVYLNYLGVGDDPDRVREAFDTATYARLAAIKAQYDPDNVFSRNQNIAPVAAD